MKIISQPYGRQYSESALRAKLRSLLRRALRGLAERALILYVLLRDPATPAWAKTAIVSALGYLICPVDAIPDILPGVGLTDDLAVLAALLGLLKQYVTPEIRAKARQMLDAL